MLIYNGKIYKHISIVMHFAVSKVASKMSTYLVSL